MALAWKFMSGRVIASKGEDAKGVLQEGMVITIEPGLYIPGLGGARMEDTNRYYNRRI